MLIEREAALKAVHEAIAEGKSWYSALSHLPSAEKTGKWVMLSPMKHLFHCSECGQWGEKYWNYCPHCGSRMGA